MTIVITVRFKRNYIRSPLEYPPVIGLGLIRPVCTDTGKFQVQQEPSDGTAAEKAKQKTKAHKGKKDVDKSKKRKTPDDGLVKWGRITEEAKKGPLGQAFAVSASQGGSLRRLPL